MQAGYAGVRRGELGSQAGYAVGLRGVGDAVCKGIQGRRLDSCGAWQPYITGNSPEPVKPPIEPFAKAADVY